jgi:peptidoglycan/LPS O-acetylase OafA/YrhL
MRIEALTFFRFLAASTVVIFHFGIPTFGANNFTVSGPKMVTFLFVLSGFVMGLAYLKK